MSDTVITFDEAIARVDADREAIVARLLSKLDQFAAENPELPRFVDLPRLPNEKHAAWCHRRVEAINAYSARMNRRRKAMELGLDARGALSRLLARFK